MVPTAESESFLLLRRAQEAAMRCITSTTVNCRCETNVRRITSALVVMRLEDLRLGLDARGALYAPFAAAAAAAGSRMHQHSKSGSHKPCAGYPVATVVAVGNPQGQPQWQLSQAWGTR
jgi:hypothetical protein